MFWFSIRAQGERKLHFALPIPFLTVLGLLDMADDWLCLFSFLCSGHKRRPDQARGAFAMSAAQSAIRACAAVAWELMLRTGPLDLAQIDISKGENRFRLRCLTR